MSLHKFDLPSGGDCTINVTSLMLQLGNISALAESQQTELFSQVKQACNPENHNQWKSDLYKDFPEYMVPNRFLSLYVPPVLLALGTFGNLLSFIIMAKSMLKVSTYSYLAVLAIMDILVLYVGLLRMWVGQFSMDVQHTSNAMCKLVNFLGYVSSDTSVWLIVAVTIERFIAVKFPLRAPRMCNVHRARFVILLIVTIICCINAHIIWTVELQYISNNGTKCDASLIHLVLVKDVWPWVDAAIYSFVPFYVISILNSLIVRQVLFARKRRSQMQHVELTSKYSSFVNKSQLKKSNESSKKLTIMLLAVSFTFLLTTLPMNLLQIVSAFFGSVADDAKRFAQMTLGRTIVELLMYVNHSINFFLYCATGRKFRRQVKIMACLCCSGKLMQYLKRERRRGGGGSPTTSYRLSRLNSFSSPRSVVIENDRRFIVGNNGKV
ncbi:growth hormone secretagogue receptor type 1-like [Ruditapes philippinarum]|uniref:growth hormone secretagogue receptor type 1-like n=1 Tax=Ruditapes philippinarum TaxID=129788 RepID=UPI00295C0068|nr:growth hormone secretagogue receptor type 1-like [Ruditapes philippinarum]